MLDQFASKGMEPLDSSRAAGNFSMFKKEIESKCAIALFKIFDEKEFEVFIDDLMVTLFFKIPVILITNFDNVGLVDRFKEIQTKEKFGDRLFLFEYIGIISLIEKMNCLEKYCGHKHFLISLEEIEVLISCSNKKDRDELRTAINNLLKNLLFTYEVNINARRSI